MTGKNEAFFEKIIDSSIPNWNRHENEVKLAKEHDDKVGYKEARIKLGTLKLSSLPIIHAYKEIYGDFPTNLESKVQEILDKCKKY